MSFITMPGLGDAQEQPLAKEDLYNLVITDAQLRNKEGKNSIMCLLQIEDTEIDYATIFHHIGLPTEGDEPDKIKAKNLFAKRFFTQFDVAVEPDGFNIEALIGCRAASVKVIQGEVEGRLNNSLQLDRLPQ